MALLRRQPWYCRNDLVLPDVTTPARQGHSVIHCVKGGVIGDLIGTPGPEGSPPNSAKATLKQTCDSVSVSTADLLGGAVFNDAVWVRGSAGSPHSWFWVQYASGFRVLFSNENFADYVFSVWGAFDDFTGGTTTARPTSVSEFAMFGNATPSTQQWAANNTANGKVHLVFAADGTFYMLSSMDSQGGPAYGNFIGKLDLPITGVTKPYGGGVLGASWNGGVNAIGQSSFTMGCRNPNNTGAQAMACGFPGFPFGNLTSVNGLNADGKVAQEDPMIYYYPGSGAGVGKVGVLPDAFWSNELPSDRMGPPTPPATQYEYHRVGALWLPFSKLPTY